MSIRDIGSDLPIFRFSQLSPSLLRPFGEPNIPTASLKEITFIYYRLLTSYKGYKEDCCTPCLEPEPTTFFCSQHAFHLPCLVNQVYASSQGLIKEIEMFRTNHISVEQFGSFKTYSHSTYTLTIPEKNLPNCPNCRSTEGMIRLEATVVDHRQGPLKTEVKVENSHEPLSLRFVGLKIFDNLTTVLTVFEAFLSSMQNSTPILTGRIFAVQRLFLIADIAIVARNCFLLCSLITQRLATINLDAWYKKHSEMITLAGVAVLGLAASAAIYFINLYFKSTIDPQEFLKNIPTSDLGSVSCKWVATSFTPRISQFAIMSRIASEFALAYFHKERFRHLSHAILQIFTLFNVSQLQWLSFERTIPNPLKTIPFTIQDSSSKEAIEIYQKAVEKIWTNFTIVVSKNTSVSDVQTTINSVYEYSSNLFKNSVWKGHTKGYETIRGYFSISKVKYEIQLAFSHFELPYIEEISALITTRLRQGVFTTIPTLIFRQ